MQFSALLNDKNIMNNHTEFFKFYIEHSNKFRELNKNIEVSYSNLFYLYKFNNMSNYDTYVLPII